MRKRDPEGQMQPKLSFKEDKVMFLSRFFKIHVTIDSTRIAELPREQGYMAVVTWAALQFHIKVTFLNWRSFCVGKGNPHVHPVHLPIPAPEHPRPPCSSTFAVPLPCLWLISQGMQQSSHLTLPVTADHTLSVLSSEPLTMRFPQNCRHVITWSSWPLSTWQPRTQKQQSQFNAGD